MKRVEYGECRHPWKDPDSQHTWYHECGLRRNHEGPHLCNYCDAEEEGSEIVLLGKETTPNAVPSGKGAGEPIPDQDCGGCMGLGSHKRWCVTVVGRAASMLGPWGDQMEEWGDRIHGVPHSQDTANMLYSFATAMEVRANKARRLHEEEQR